MAAQLNPDEIQSAYIDMEDRKQVAFWTEKLDLTKVQLKAAVNAAGNIAVDVVNYLEKRNKKEAKN